MFILVDDEDRENEGDLVIPAQMATPDAINFMAKHGRGLICLALTRDRVDQLGLQLMSRDTTARRHRDRLHHLDRGQGGRHHRHLRRRPGAHDLGRDRRRQGPRAYRHARPRLPAGRARRRRAGPRRPYRGRGRRRRGSPGSIPSGVICEIMREDGTMARMDDLFAFAQLHNLQDRHDPRPDRLSPAQGPAGRADRRGAVRKPLGRRPGRAMTFLNKASGAEQIALVKGQVDPAKPTLVRMHAPQHRSPTSSPRTARAAACSRARCRSIARRRRGRDRRDQPADARRAVARR